VINLGCPKNQVDSEVISGLFLFSSKFELISSPEDAEIIVVNTCGFIEDAKRESLDVIFEMAEFKKEGKCEKLYVIGCLAQRYGKELLKEIPELDGVLGDGDLVKTVNLITNHSDKNINEKKIYTNKKVQDFIYSDEMPRNRFGPKHFAYLKIAEGCDNCCSYCAIPLIKGRYRSRTIESIVKEARKLALEGVKEIALVAQDTTRYGLDYYGELRLASLLRELVKIEGLEWIRLLYCYPDVFTDEMVEIMASESKICKYVDLPLQHADNQILQKMNRRNTVEEALALISNLRKAIPEIFIRSTFITGFPGETEQQFQNLLNFIRETKLDRVGVFAYSEEDNTPAAKMPDQIPVSIREKRKNMVMELQADLAYDIQQKRVGKNIRAILEERISDKVWLGRTEGDAPEIDGQIFLEGAVNHTVGDIVTARITKADSYDFEGRIL